MQIKRKCIFFKKQKKLNWFKNINKKKKKIYKIKY